MVNARIRGIYSTALTRLLLENGFTIVQPSATTRERFDLPTEPEDRSQPHLDIYDRLDRQGVNAVGDDGSLKAFAQVLGSALDDAVFRRRLSTYGETGGPADLTDSKSAAQTSLRGREASSSGARVRLNVEFPGSSKKKLDSLRALVTPTLDGHHHYKACGGRISTSLEMAEKMLEKGCLRKEVEGLFEETMERDYPCEGSAVGIEHVKIDGKKFDLGVAELTEFDGARGLVRLMRTFVKKGVYNGLGIPKEPGDCAVTEMKLGEWYFQTRYYSSDGRYKGTYVNLNTPLELYPSKIRYVDLEVDICLWPDGRTRRIDRDKLEDMILRGYVSEKLGRIVDEKTEEILNSLSPKAEKDRF